MWFTSVYLSLAGEQQLSSMLHYESCSLNLLHLTPVGNQLMKLKRLKPGSVPHVHQQRHRLHTASKLPSCDATSQ
ncbi:hypothetical protein CgunFtcFv8_007919 [Champsocephalus gunnari]|uniref:Uncharacterized protein n=1 Tax=Champsocephalus gunnari TaxID=52237 RepID=A0AAN8CZE3_CHAGU|nr:hypothetical protein CgunFtcFv8_007919 [Champsocephalus gunnari]